MIAAVVAAVASAVGGAYAWRAARAPAGVRSLVVMPFSSFGSSASQPYLEQGMADALATRLAGIDALRVPPTVAVRAGEDPFAAAKRLDVDAVLTGSVERAGD